MVSLFCPNEQKQHDLDFLKLLQKSSYTILYFYPKDNTSGCTREAQNFSNTIQDFEKVRCQIVGVSKDSLISHEKFCQQHNLSFCLVSDESLELHQQFATRIQKSMYGKLYMGTERSTFLLDGTGSIIHEWRKVSVTDHVEEVLAFLSHIT